MNLLREAGTGERTEQERVQSLLVLALVRNFLGQIQLSNADYDPRGPAVHGGPGRGPQQPGPVHDPHLPVRPGAQQPGPGRPGRRRGIAQARAVAGGRSRRRANRRLLPRGAGRRSAAAGRPAARRRLLAAAGAQLQASGSGWLHAYVPHAPHDHSIEAELRSQMGDAAYEQAAAHGRSLTGTRAIRDGLEDAPQDPQRQESPA